MSAVERALALDPAQRFTDAAELERALLPVLGGDSGALATQRRLRWRRARRWAMGGMALLAAGVAAWLAGPYLARTSSTLRERPALVAGRVVLEVKGTTAAGSLGHAVANAGDVNHDGHSDLLVGAPGEGDNAGRVYLFLLGPDADKRPELTMSGEAPGDRFGISMTAAGDLNGDGHDDFAVAASFNDAGGRNAGRVHVYHGGPDLDGRPDLVLTGEHPQQDLGFWIAPAGDVNADGFDDLLVGAPLDAQSGFYTGRAYLWFGGPRMDALHDLELTTVVQNGQFGATVAGIGDWNADGHDDFAVGANWDLSDGQQAGRVYVYFGGPRLDDRPDRVLHGHARGEQLGILGRGGDVNGDGHPDVVVGAEYGNGFERRSGAVYVYHGGPGADGSADLRLRGERRGDGFGFTPDASADLDGDGANEIVVGARYHEGEHGRAGRVYVYRGGPRMDDAPELKLDGSMEGVEFGLHSCVVDDLGGDGLPDLAVGAAAASLAGAGGVQVFDLARWQILSPRPGASWRPGARTTVAWSGVTRADVSWSLDGGHTWRPLARRAGGRERNTLAVTVPAEAAGAVRVRIVASDPPRRGSMEVQVPVR